MKPPCYEGGQYARVSEVTPFLQRLSTYLEDLEERVVRLESRRRPATKDDIAKLLRSLTGPEVFNCPECGPFFKSDEDGCCTACGAEMNLLSFDLALEVYEATLTEE